MAVQAVQGMVKWKGNNVCPRGTGIPRAVHLIGDAPMVSIPLHTPRNNTPRILEQGLIRTEDDLTRLNFIDWNRSSYSNNPAKTVRGIANWTRKAMKYSIMRCDMHKSPKRDDFPDWKHAGCHEHLGLFYWNWFHHQFEASLTKELHFFDSPDFSGSITFPDRMKIQFWGDIGKCSAFAFFESLLQMRPGDLWITIRDSSVQVILEAQVDFFAIDTLWQYKNVLFTSELVPLEKPTQMCLF